MQHFIKLLKLFAVKIDGNCHFSITIYKRVVRLLKAKYIHFSLFVLGIMNFDLKIKRFQVEEPYGYMNKILQIDDF